MSMWIPLSKCLKVVCSRGLLSLETCSSAGLPFCRRLGSWLITVLTRPNSFVPLGGKVPNILFLSHPDGDMPWTYASCAVFVLEFFGVIELCVA